MTSRLAESSSAPEAVEDQLHSGGPPKAIVVVVGQWGSARRLEPPAPAGSHAAPGSP